MSTDVIAKYLSMLESQGDPIAKMLSVANKNLDETLRARLKLHTKYSITLAQMEILKTLCLKGMRSTELADRMGQSKQAVGPVVQELETQGFIKRRIDPQDSRAKIIEYTPKGRELISRLLDANLEIERKLAKSFGSANWIQFKKNLSLLCHN